MNGNISYGNLAPSLQRRIDTVGGGSNSFFKQYPLITTGVNQKTWDLPADSYDTATDSLVVFQNTVYLEPTSYTITGTTGAYNISIPDNPHSAIADNHLTVLVLKNAPATVEQISGTLLTDSSVGLAKLGQDVQDELAKAGSANSHYKMIAPVAPTVTPDDSVFADGVTTFLAYDIATFAKEWAQSLGLSYPLIANAVIVETKKNPASPVRRVQEVTVLSVNGIIRNKYVRTSGLSNTWGNWKKIIPDIVDDLTTGGADKVASAETVKTLEVSKASNTALNTTNVVAQQHYQSIATTEKLGHVMLVDDLTTGGNTKALTAEQGKVLFQSVSNGKALVASAITGKGVTTASDATFQQLATNISAIQSNGGGIQPKFYAFGVDWTGDKEYLVARNTGRNDGSVYEFKIVKVSFPFLPDVVAISYFRAGSGGGPTFFNYEYSGQVIRNEDSPNRWKMKGMYSDLGYNTGEDLFYPRVTTYIDKQENGRYLVTVPVSKQMVQYGNGLLVEGYRKPFD